MKWKNREEYMQFIKEQQEEIISENLVGIDFLTLCPSYNMMLLTKETEDLGGFGIYVKGEW